MKPTSASFGGEATSRTDQSIPRSQCLSMSASCSAISACCWQNTNSHRIWMACSHCLHFCFGNECSHKSVNSESHKTHINFTEHTTKRWPCLGSQEAWGVNWVHTPSGEGQLSPSISKLVKWCFCVACHCAVQNSPAYCHSHTSLVYPKAARPAQVR